MLVVLATMFTGHMSFGGYLKDHMYCNNMHTAVQKLQAQTKGVAEEITGDMLHDTFGKSMMSEGLVLNVCSHEGHVHTKSP
jgi:hypothetical protein